MANIYFQTKVQDEVGTLAINRPDARNALSQAMWQELPVLLEQLQADGARVIVLTGTNGCFSAGADLSELAALANRQDAAVNWLSIKEALDYVAEFPLPVIAMIDGPCLGGGLLLAAAADVRLCTPVSTFAVPVARMGIILDDGNLLRLSQALGSGLARFLIYTGREIDAQKALRAGLVQDVLSATELGETARAWAKDMVSNAASAVEAAKQAFLRLNDSAGCATEENQDSAVDSYMSPEFRQRIAQFSRRP